MYAIRSYYVVKLLDLRKSTLYNITLILIEKQYEFFMGGELRPLKLLDVAEELGFNESTVSRAISDKYLETERGVFSFKDFFSNAIGEVSTAEINRITSYNVCYTKLLRYLHFPQSAQ